MKIAICDDEKKSNEHLHGLLKSYMEKNKITNADFIFFISGQTLLNGYSVGLFDFIFLDVQMPVLDGFETARQLRLLDLDVDLIFVTNMTTQVIRGYNYNAKQYLCKPVCQDDIDVLMDRLLSELNRKRERGTYTIKMKDGKGTAHVPLSDLIYFESDDRYLRAITQNETYIFRGKLSDVEADLEDRGFIRIHQSYLVNKEYVFKDFGNALALKDKGGTELPVSKPYKNKVHETFKGVW